MNTTIKQSPLERLIAVQAILDSEAHYQATPTRAYGDIDPVNGAAQTLFPCACGGASRLLQDLVPLAKGRRTRHFVQCSACGQTSIQARSAWGAVVLWNKSPAAQHPRLQAFPFFGIQALPLEVAADRLRAIRRDLELRKEEAELQSTLRIEVGRNYFERIQAYLGWVLVAFSVLASEQRVRADEESSGLDRSAIGK